MKHSKNLKYQKIQSIVGEKSFSLVLPKAYASSIGIQKGDFVKVIQEGQKIIIEKDAFRAYRNICRGLSWSNSVLEVN
jgi:bifunctional DNA-binding transcriptional regulator/antitoxin component of YhaV-PrlF toxin-antitoxin module